MPDGSGQDLAKLTVTTPLGSYPVAASGEFSAEVFAGAVSELDVETPAGELLLVGLTDGASAQASTSTTAKSLLYYLVGGMWLPAEQQDKVRGLLDGVPEVEAIADELERQLRAGNNGVADADAATVAAIQAAHVSLAARAGVAPLMASAQAAAAATSAAADGRLGALAVDSSNIIVEPTTSQSGVEVVHNPSGIGVVAQNSYRRPAALLAYEVSWEDLDGVETEVSPPELVEQVDVPATGQLELLNAVWDAVTGAAPWAPELSEPLRLTGHEGASRTHYQLVLVGPSLAGGTPAILNDPRFSGMHDAWDDIIMEKSLELFLDQLVLPLMEVYGLGSMARLDAAKLAKMRDRVRIIHDKHLRGLGVYLKAGPTGYNQGLKFVIRELVENNTYRLDMTNMIREALAESDQNKATIDAVDGRLSARASATAIAAAVETVLVSGDVGKIMYDLGAARTHASWTATSMPALFSLSPENPKVRPGFASVALTVSPKGSTSGNFRYRWTTTGAHGELSDLLQDGKTLDTDQNEVHYFHNAPNLIKDSDRDDVRVEVFEVPEGATSIPAGAKPIGRMATVVRGDTRLLDSRIEINYGTTPADLFDDGTQYPCAELLIRFDRDPKAVQYVIRFKGFGGYGDPRNPNREIRNGDPTKWSSQQFDASPTPLGNMFEYRGPCKWYDGQGRAWDSDMYYGGNGTGGWLLLDTRNNTVVYVFFTLTDFDGDLGLAGNVELWTDWTVGASIEVEPLYPEDLQR